MPQDVNDVAGSRPGADLNDPDTLKAVIDAPHAHIVSKDAAHTYGLTQEVFQVSKANDGASADVHAIGTADYPTRAERPKRSRLSLTKLEDEFEQFMPSWTKGVEACIAQLLRSQRISDFENLRSIL